MLFLFFSFSAEDYQVFGRLEFVPQGGESTHPAADHFMPWCDCKLFDGQPCYRRFDGEKMLKFCITSMELLRDNLDASILGRIVAGFYQSEMTI